MSISVRTINNHGHPYRQRVEYTWDPKLKQCRTRVLENLGPVTPIYRIRAPPTAPAVLPLEAPHFGLLATRIMSGTLTPAHILQTVQEMGQEIPPGDLAAVGIRYDLGEKTLELLLWPSLPPSPRPRPARPARRPASGRGPGTPGPSRSRARGT